MENRGFGPHSPAAAGDWRGGARSPPSGHSKQPGGGRPSRSAPRSLALLNTPWPTWRTLKLHCALFSQPQPFPTLHRAAARARGGGRGLEAGRRHGARVPPTPGARPRSPRPAAHHIGAHLSADPRSAYRPALQPGPVHPSLGNLVVPHSRRVTFFTISFR